MRSKTQFKHSQSKKVLIYSIIDLTDIKFKSHLVFLLSTLPSHIVENFKSNYHIIRNQMARNKSRREMSNNVGQQDLESISQDLENNLIENIA